jgi:hypothetical protein
VSATETLKKDPETGKWRWYKPGEGVSHLRREMPNADVVVKGDLNSVLHSAPRGLHKGTKEAADYYDKDDKPCFRSRQQLREWLARDADTGDTHHAWDGEL